MLPCPFPTTITITITPHAPSVSAVVRSFSDFESHWVPLSYGLVPHLSKKLSKFQLLDRSLYPYLKIWLK